MRITAQLDAEEFARTGPEHVRLLVGVEASAAPAPDSLPGRAGTSLQIVLDVRDALTARALEELLDAIAGVVHRLDERDTFGLVTVGHDVEVVVPAGPLTDKDDVVERLAGVRRGGGGDLEAAYRKGLEEARQVAGGGGAILVVSSDGSDPAPGDQALLADLAGSAGDAGTRTSTLSYGSRPGTALAALADAGGGGHHDAAEPSEAGAAIARTLGLPAGGVGSVRLVVSAGGGVELVSVDGRPVEGAPEQTHVAGLPDLDFDERRSFTVDLRLTEPRSHRLTSLGTLELLYVDLPTSGERRVVIPAILQAPLRLPGPAVSRSRR